MGRSGAKVKFRTNFSYSFGGLVPALTAFGWCLAFLAAVGGVSMAVSTAQYRRENPALKQELGDLEKNPPVQAKPASMPSDQDLAALRRRLKILNALEAGEGGSVSSVLSRLEGLLPPGARLMSFQQDQRSGEIQMGVEAGNLEELSKFLADMEGDSTFTQVNLTKQSLSQGGGGHWIQFSVELRERRP